MSEGSLPSESDVIAELLSQYFEPIVVDHANVVVASGGARVMAPTEAFLGYRLRSGQTFNQKLLTMMAANGIDVRTIYCENTQGQITHIPVREGADITRRDPDGSEHERGTIALASLSLRLGESSLLSAPAAGPIADDPSQQLRHIYRSGLLQSVILRTGVRLPDTNQNRQLPHSDISIRYHHTPSTVALRG